MNCICPLFRFGLVSLCILFSTISCACKDEHTAKPTRSELRLKLKEIAMERQDPGLSEDEAESLRAEFFQTLDEIRNLR